MFFKNLDLSNQFSMSFGMGIDLLIERMNLETSLPRALTGQGERLDILKWDFATG